MKWCKNGVVGDKNRKKGREKPINTEVLEDMEAYKQEFIDFAIIEGYFQGDYYKTKIFKSEEYIAVASANHVFEKPIHCLNDLKDERLIIREHGSGTRVILTKTLALKNMSVKDFRNLIEIENIHTIVQLLKDDCGISFLYKAAVAKELKEGTLVQIPLSDFMVMHNFTFLWNKDSIFSTEYESIFKELQSVISI